MSIQGGGGEGSEREGESETKRGGMVDEEHLELCGRRCQVNV